MTGESKSTRESIIESLEKNRRYTLSHIESEMALEREYLLWHLMQLEEDGVVESVERKTAGESVWKLLDTELE